MMMTMRKLVLASCLLVAAGSALAHRFHASLTDISHNPRTGSLEVVINLMAHDIEALLAQGGNPNVDIGAAEGEALVRQYVQQRFQLLGKDGKPLALAWVGMKANADSLQLLLELERADAGVVGRIRNAILTDLLPNQENTVNFQGTSYSFDREKVESTVR